MVNMTRGLRRTTVESRCWSPTMRETATATRSSGTIPTLRSARASTARYPSPKSALSESRLQSNPVDHFISRLRRSRPAFAFKSPEHPALTGHDPVRGMDGHPDSGPLARFISIVQ
eukprot:1326715-Rhodomonas_salina.2